MVTFLPRLLEGDCKDVSGETEMMLLLKEAWTGRRAFLMPVSHFADISKGRSLPGREGNIVISDSACMNPQNERRLTAEREIGNIWLCAPLNLH